MTRKFNINGKASSPPPPLIPLTKLTLSPTEINSPHSSLHHGDPPLRLRAHLNPSREAQRTETQGGGRGPDKLAQREFKTPWQVRCARGAGIVGALRDTHVSWEGEEKENEDGSGKGGRPGMTENERLLRERRRG
ncbi:hypothetical protein LOCC1_G000149 [Lachnellula occidentalis]|uniref:Uncharacterized protein n=1 Tax=Lachnellula occidentalis TaxID=215460 RepID=A0A8H8SA61_9HELO|nr:hypothetical protein LOCC1_G000149 [Lachnellula occidentalis]